MQIRRKSKIQTRKLEEEEVAKQFKLGVSERTEVETPVTAENQCNKMKQALLEEVVRVCGRKKPVKPTEKDTWWWSEEVQTAVKKKKESSSGAIQEYRKSKREAKRVVAVAKAKSTEKNLVV